MSEGSPALEVIAVACGLLTRALDYSDLTGRNSLFWKSGQLREVVAHGGSTVGVFAGDIIYTRFCTITFGKI